MTFHLALNAWLHVGLQLVMFGMAWLAASRLSQVWRRTLFWLAAFNLVEGTALVLTGLGGVLPFWLTNLLPSLLVVAAYPMLWLTGAMITGAAKPRREPLVVIGLSSALLLWVGAAPDQAQLLQAIAVLANAYVAWRGGWQLGRHLRASGQVRTGTTVIVLCFGMAVALALRALVLMVAGGQQELDGWTHSATAYVSMAAVFAMNVLAAYLIFGRMLRAVDRLSQSDPLTGLPTRSGVERVLDYELARHRHEGRQLAVVVLALDRAPALRAAWGSATADAVTGEVALVLRAHLAPNDLLGLDGAGRFVACLFDTSAAEAARTLRVLVASVANDAGLHPDSGQRLRLNAGLAMAASGLGPAQLLDAATQRCGQLDTGGAPAAPGGGARGRQSS